MELLIFCGGLCAGIVLTLLISKSMKSKQGWNENEQLEKAMELSNQNASREAALQLREEELQKLKESMKTLQSDFNQVQIESSAYRERIENLNEKIKNQNIEKEKANEQLKQQFTLLGQEIFNRNTKDFAERHQKSLNEVLSPFKQKLGDFEKKINETYDKDLRDRISLKDEVKRLCEMNQVISQDAQNLTKALKGDVKMQGNWGELILERVLEASGLQEGEEFELQESSENEDGRRIQPDVIVHLPDHKHLVIDAKVSLVAYEKYIQADDENKKSKYLQEHLLSLRRHIKELSEKKYHSATNLDTPEFVMLFLPIESSFGLAVREDIEIFTYGWEQKIILVCPTTLLATLKTVASLWKQDKQNKNAEKIARESGLLYNKFVGFVEDLEGIGQHIDKTRLAYDQAFRKLSHGPGNLISKVEKIKKLGAKTNKKLDEQIIALSEAHEPNEKESNEPSNLAN